MIFSQPDCTGRQIEVHGFIVDIGASGMRGGPSSIQIDRGVWELCSGTNYTGQCWNVNRDNGDLGRLAGAAGSARSAACANAAGLLKAPGPAIAVSPGAAVLFGRPGRAGRELAGKLCHTRARFR